MRFHIPAYALYGEQSELNWNNFFNMEWISRRSSIYDWRIDPHLHHNLIQVLFIQHGNVDILLNYTRSTARSPCLILVPMQTVHSLHYTPDVEGLTITAAQEPLESIARQIMPDMLTLIHQPTVIPLNHNGDSDKILTLYQAIERELRIPAVGQIALCTSLFSVLFINIMRISHMLQQQCSDNNCSRKATQIDKFLDIVEQKFRMRLSICDYANEMAMTPGHLSRLCRITLGMSGLDVINMRVIQEAQRELVFTSKTIKQLASTLGFADEAYFTRFFRKHVSMSPRNFRMQATQKIFMQEDLPPGVKDSRYGPQELRVPTHHADGDRA